MRKVICSTILVITLIIMLFSGCSENEIDKTVTIGGFILDEETNEPLSDIYVELLEDFGDDSLDIASTRTNSEGYFEFKDVKHPDDLETDITDPYGLKIEGDHFHFNKYTWDISTNDKNEIHIKPGGFLQGSVTDGINSLTQSTFVCIRNNDNDLFENNQNNYYKCVIHKIQQNGSFISTLIEPGEYQIRLITDEYKPTNWIDIKIENKKTSIIELSPPTIKSNISLIIESEVDVPIYILKKDEVIGGGISENNKLNICLESPGEYILTTTDYSDYYWSYIEINLTEGENKIEFWVGENDTG